MLANAINDVIYAIPAKLAIISEFTSTVASASTAASTSAMAVPRPVTTLFSEPVPTSVVNDTTSFIPAAVELVAATSILVVMAITKGATAIELRISI